MSENFSIETAEETESVSEPLAGASEVLEDTRSVGTPEELLDGSVKKHEELPETPVNSPEDSERPVVNNTSSPEEDLLPQNGEQETFPRSYVEKLRKEAAGHRDRAKRADDLSQRLHTALVEATGRLADAGDLPFDESHLDDPVALTTAIDDLLASKPHLASRKPMGNIGQGVAPVSNDVSLGGILRAGAM